MSEENNNPNPLTDGNLGTFVSDLARVVNETYSYNNNSSLFCSLIPQYNRDYAWRYVRTACEWLDGYVPAIHDGTSGIPSTRIAQKLIAGVGRQVCGEKLIFKLASETVKDEETLHFVSEWANKQNIIKAIYNGVCYSMAVGTSLVKLNMKVDTNNELQVWWEAKRFDQCYYLASNDGEVYDALFYIRSYTDTRQQKDGGKAQYILVEHRYYQIYDKPVLKGDITELGAVAHKKGDRVPMVCYEVYRTNGTALNNTMGLFKNGGISWEEISKEVRDMIKHDYAILRIGEPQELPFKNLGVSVWEHSYSDISVPTMQGCGESMIVGIQSDLITYEYAEACQLRDMYLGKGQVYLPKSLSMGDFGKGNGQGQPNALSQMGNDNGAIQLMKGVDPEQQKAIVQQFDVRVETWQAIKENSLKDIAVKWGMSAKILASYLAQGQAQQTATQVDSEDDMSIAFINLTRSYYLPKINELIETTLGFYGKVNNISVQFASPSLINKDRLLDRIQKQLDMGLIDIEEAIRTYYCDAPEDEIQTKIEIAKVEREKMQNQALAEFNEYGDYENDNFGEQNNLDNLGGKNLNGSTKPAQNELN